MYTKRNLIFNLIQNVFVGLAITIAVTLMTEGFTTVLNFFVSFLKAYVINYAACLIFPVPFLSSLLFKLFKIKPQSIWRLIITVLLCDFFYVTFISIIMFLWQLGFTALAMQVWWSTYGVLLLVGFVTGIVFANVSNFLTDKIVRGGALRDKNTESGKDNEI